MTHFMDLIVDSFAGGGGASTGIEAALGRSPDIAINHDPLALAMHAANHPTTYHACEDVYRTDLRRLTKGQPVGLLWASPDCRHFSRAKGSKPVSKSVRSLAWMVVKWAEQVRPRVIVLENVREFADWGPLVPQWKCADCDWKGTEGQATLVRTRRRCPRCESLKITPTLELLPDPARKGLTYRRFVGRLKNLGYAVETKNLDAADYGAPTHRRRLFLAARCDGLPIEFPEPTHGDPKNLNDSPLFARPKPWVPAAACIDWHLPIPSIFDPEARRAAGLKPVLVEKTLWRIAHCIKRYVLDAPRPFTTANRGEFALCVPSLTQTGYGERKGQAPRILDVNAPLGTVVAGGGKHALVSAFLVKHFGGMVGLPCTEPLPTTTAVGTQNQLGAVSLVRLNHDDAGLPVDAPLPTQATRSHVGLVAGSLIHFNHGDKQWSGLDEPMRTITSSGKHAALVYSFLVKYFGTAIGANLLDPAPTITTKDRFGLVVVAIEGELYAIVDIGMRMLTPRELARAQGFPESYVLTGTKSQQVARIGNSVCPLIAAAMVRALCGVEAEACA